MRARRSLCRISAVVVAVLWVLAPVLALLHDVNVEHVYCAEHGTFEEAGSTGRRSSPTTRETATLSEDARPEPAAHHACVLKSVQPHAGVAERVRSAGMQPRRAEATVRLFTSHLSPIPILAVAPKSSPPVIA